MPDTATTYTMDFTPPADALRFIELLTGSAESTMHFRTFSDNRDNPKPAWFSYAQLNQFTNFSLKQRQDLGQGVFIGINEYKVDNYDGATNDEDITNIRAFFVDSDGVEMPEHWHLEPTFICWRSDTRWHAYWVLADRYNPSKFKDAQLRLADNYNTDHEVCNPSRVMRVPGYLHHCALSPRPLFEDYGGISDVGIRAKLDSRLLTLLRDGNRVRGQAFKPLGAGLFEVKAKSVRVLYGFLPGEKIVVVEACYKDQRTLPARVIENARSLLQRAKQDHRLIHGTSYTN